MCPEELQHHLAVAMPLLDMQRGPGPVSHQQGPQRTHKDPQQGVKSDR